MKDKSSFSLVKEFTFNHQINLVVADSQKQQAIFVIHSLDNGKNSRRNRLIDEVTFLKAVLGADDNLSY
jgi:hypothetical protein